MYDKENEFSVQLSKLFYQYKALLTKEDLDDDKVLACKLLVRQIDVIFNKGVFNGGDLIALLEVLIASDVLHEESTSNNEVYFQMCNDRLKDLLYVSFQEVVVNA